MAGSFDEPRGTQKLNKLETTIESEDLETAAEYRAMGNTQTTSTRDEPAKEDAAARAELVGSYSPTIPGKLWAAKVALKVEGDQAVICHHKSLVSEKQVHQWLEDQIELLAANMQSIIETITEAGEFE